MNTKIIFSKLFSILGLFIGLSLYALNAQAEYYVVYGEPVVEVVSCAECGNRIVSAPYHPHRHYVHHPRRYHPHHRYYHSCHAAENYYSITTYYVWQTIPATPCGAVQTTPMCKSCGQWTTCDSPPLPPATSVTYSSPTFGYESNDEYGTDLDRATADDDPDMYPGMDIDN